MLLTQNPLIIRADASVNIGTGHVMRCLALAQAWHESGGVVTFLFAFPLESLEKRILSEGFQTVYLDAAEPGSIEDAAETATIAGQQEAQWVVIDGYHFDADYQRKLKEVGLKVLFVDDYGHASHYYADIILNQNVYAQPNLYSNKEPYTQLCLGSKYVLLRREFWEWRAWQRPYPEKIRNILVTLGGSDPHNATEAVVRALKQLAQSDLEVVVLIGAHNPHYDSLKLTTSKDHHIQLRKNVSNMPELMAWADLAISAGGSTNWELAFMGLPSFIITIAENQEPIADALDSMGIASALGWDNQLTTDSILHKLKWMLADLESYRQMSKRGRDLVDGDGQRLIKKMVNSSLLNLKEI